MAEFLGEKRWNVAVTLESVAPFRREAMMIWMF